jgi:transposase
MLNTCDRMTRIVPGNRITTSGTMMLLADPPTAATSPRRGEKASYYLAVCLDEVELMELVGNTNHATSAACLKQLRDRHAEPLTVTWDNSPIHRGDALRACLSTRGFRLRLVNSLSSIGQALPSYSPDFNAEEAIWGWVRQEVTTNLRLGTKAAVQEQVNNFFAQLVGRKAEVERRCRTVLQSGSDELQQKANAHYRRHANVYPPWLRFGSHRQSSINPSSRADCRSFSTDWMATVASSKAMCGLSSLILLAR